MKHEADAWTPAFSTVEEAIDVLRRGRMIILVDDADREDEGDLVMLAEYVTPEAINFMITYGRGLVCVPLTAERAKHLRLHPMVDDEAQTDPHRTAFTVSVDEYSTRTGISAYERAKTIRALVEETTRPEDLRRPGHIFPLVARPGGLLERRGHTEASIALAQLAGAQEVTVICEIVADDGTMARQAVLQRFAERHNLPMLTIADLIRYLKDTKSNMDQYVHSSHMSAKDIKMLKQNTQKPSLEERISEKEALVSSDGAKMLEKTDANHLNAVFKQMAERLERTMPVPLPTPFGTFSSIAYRDRVTGVDHLVLVMGEIHSTVPTLVRMHSECLTGDVFGSKRCDCGPQLHQALQQIAHEGQGVILYMRQEGRGIGLFHKLRAYALQDQGHDTVEANRLLGFPDDARDYAAAAYILHDLGVASIRLLTNNPHKLQALEFFGFHIDERVPLVLPANEYNARYLRAKSEKMGHLLGSLTVQ